MLVCLAFWSRQDHGVGWCLGANGLELVSNSGATSTKRSQVERESTLRALARAELHQGRVFPVGVRSHRCERFIAKNAHSTEIILNVLVTTISSHGGNDSESQYPQAPAPSALVSLAPGLRLLLEWNMTLRLPSCMTLPA